MSIEPIAWSDGSLRLLDQTRLPREEVWLTPSDYHDVAQAIRVLSVRGAPAIGVAAAYGLVLAAAASPATTLDGLLSDLRTAAGELAATRPTAVNLSWALKRTLAVAEAADSVDRARAAVLEEAQRIQREDIEGNRRLGRFGAELLPEQATVLTHCNAGALATAGYGTALGVVRAAVEGGKRLRVVATETRPLLQGARLTAWELARDGIDCTLIVDGAAAALMRRGDIDLVVVGADRIAANGDTANKIGTYSLALGARESGLPFYVAAPTSTVDLSLPSGDDIPIEERSPDEVTSHAETRSAPEGVAAANPAFDITPYPLIAAIITERGVARPPYTETLAAQMALTGAEATR
ncbi:MAG: S-methyl-5-thioribose-1-phosphate isomerase [Dehalococcoidia bacterium]